ncbi:MAG: hypothetical protein Crog4KO_23460 [Crocinitomicaceae bacterium]
MKAIKLTIYFFIFSFVLSSCMTGKYVSEATGPNSITQAPMKLKLCGKAKYTYYSYSNSAVQMYEENAKFKKKGDTLFMRARTYYADTTTIGKKYYPEYLIVGDSLVSLDHDVAYIKQK